MGNLTGFSALNDAGNDEQLRPCHKFSVCVASYFAVEEMKRTRSSLTPNSFHLCYQCFYIHYSSTEADVTRDDFQRRFANRNANEIARDLIG